MKKPAKAPANNGHDHRHCVEDALSAAERLCAQKGLRFTPLRRRVLELVWSSHKPVGAYALLDELRSEDLGSAPPTIYRALDFLIENGLIHRIEKMNAFVGCSHPGETHRGFFLICNQCGNAEELDSDSVAEAITSSASRRGFVPRDMTLEVTGLCGECRRQN
ncbi:Fur family transcriptional regulator, zinc uptake regulator [Enhydrobacter aerosaccus]|uniref:Ferric uptake regulation protein n=1 Tax=Enhydrobacter aerosaccus TaxID=225324 RepID=A0A1T4L5N8_9HYPH|nr:Fur family transcriptional regulator, zinc uptake regulator [Enhydrobacter aerosaccus]